MDAVCRPADPGFATRKLTLGTREVTLSSCKVTLEKRKVTQRCAR